MATRIFELARELGVTSKVVLAKCRAEGLDVKNHMATLSAGLEATIREWFTEGPSATAVETSEHIDLEAARTAARKQRRHGGKKEAPPEEAPAEAVEAAPVAVAEAPPEAPAAEAPAEPPVAEAPAEAPAGEAPAEPPVAKAPVEEAPAAPAEAALLPSPAPPPAPQPPRPPVRPAGPQLVPRPAKLQGPRVVRVERPDFVQAPRRRPPPVAGAPQPVGPTGVRKAKGKGKAVEEEEAAGAKTKRRSPRRRGGGRSADSGEAAHEWRNQDLLERAERLSAAAGGGTLRRHRASLGGRQAEGGPGLKSGQIEIDEPITVKSLSAACGIKAGQFIRKLLDLGIMATVNQVIARETAEAILVDYGVELAVRREATAEEALAERLAQRTKGDLVNRPPVVTFLGHVDHGKTSLLDRIRSASVATGEAGGITQHIGAYRYDRGNSHVVFLDTPGHEAFTAMRARGANMTDVVVLVVAADDGVMPQTLEAINHAKAAGVPIVVALNKIDLPNANENRVLGQLAEHGLQPREWGGNVEIIRTSAATGQGIDALVETLSLEAELLELKSEKDAPASGYVIESRMDPGMGVLARLLVRDGTLRIGGILLAGQGFGRVRSMQDGLGRQIQEAPPATPVEVAGLDELPEAGDRFYVVDSLEQARAVAEDRRQRARSRDLAAVPERTLESMLRRIEAGHADELAVILKADVQGSLEAIQGSIDKLSTDQVRVRILHAAVGGITTGDVSLAEASDAIILGFNVVPDSSARRLAEECGVDIRPYRIIYDMIEDIRKALEEGLAPEIREQTLGRAEVRQVFKFSRVGTIAGCYVVDGLVNRSAKVRVTRNNVVIADERTLESLKRLKDDVREVRAGMECGLKIAGYDDVKESDLLEFYQKVEVARKL